MAGHIFIDQDGVEIDLKKILREMREFPAAAEVAVSEGGTSKTANEFREEVRFAAEEMSEKTTQIVAVLDAMQQTMRSVVNDLVENDASLADEANVLAALLDSASEQSGTEQSVSDEDAHEGDRDFG